MFVYVECLEQADFLAKSENSIRDQKCREATSATAAVKDDKRLSKMKKMKTDTAPFQVDSLCSSTDSE